MYARFAQIGLGTGEGFELDHVSPETKEALDAGVKDGFSAMGEMVAKVTADSVSSANVFRRLTSW